MKLFDKLRKKEPKPEESATAEPVSPFVVTESEEVEILYAPPTIDALDEDAALSVLPKGVTAPAETAAEPTNNADTDMDGAAADEFDSDPAELAEDFLLGLLSHLGISAEVEIMEPQAGVMNVNLNDTEDYGRLIGKRGETLDAIQRITNTVVNRYTKKHIHIRVDAGNYHAKREESVKAQAKRTASRVVKLRRSITMEPMNAFERHVVHETLQDFGGVSTYSTGTEPRRCVVVSYGSGKGGNRYGSR